MTWPLPALSDEERLTFAELPAFEVHLRAWMEVQADHTHRGLSRMACGCGAVFSNVDERSEHVTDVVLDVLSVPTGTGRHVIATLLRNGTARDMSWAELLDIAYVVAR